MVNAAETLLELNVPFVVLTLWQDNSLVKSVQTKRARTEERDALRVLMERRTRILLGRSVRRKEARQKIRDAYARAVKMPQGKGYVALEEALAEARRRRGRRGWIGGRRHAGGDSFAGEVRGDGRPGRGADVRVPAGARRRGEPEGELAAREGGVGARGGGGG